MLQHAPNCHVSILWHRVSVSMVTVDFPRGTLKQNLNTLGQQLTQYNFFVLHFVFM